MNRKEFLRLAGSVTVLLANGQVTTANNISGFSAVKPNVAFRFAVASDGHFGEEKTEYESHFSNVVAAINKEHARHPFKFSVINGDIVHNDKAHYPAAKKALDGLECKYYVTQGNHDHVTAEEWQSVWNMPVNFDFTYKRCAFLLATTSNEKGEYLCPDLEWLSGKLKEHKNREVFIFIHINPGALTKYAVDCPPFFELLEKHGKVRAVFNGHDHDEDGIKKRNNTPFVFDSHFGGSWGTEYRGYRIVEVMKDGSVITYVMNPDTAINQDKLV
ncbi:MAG: metallophosphoesterase [Chitinophagaceae bacterium]|nr:metallophosphoesterase [Chitinophagaceae bacterium]